MPPGPAFDISGAKGKKILNIPASSANPFLGSIDAGMQEVARTAGISWIQYENQGDPADWGRGVDQAVTQDADVIILNAPDANLLGPKLRRARKAGVKVVSAHLYDEDMKLPIELSESKAYTALMVEVPTGDLYDLVQPGGPFYGFTGTQGGRIVAFAGGLPLRRDGRVTGGIGVSGGSAEQDGVIAARAIERLEGHR